jgi:hypothetical protein
MMTAWVSALTILGDRPIGLAAVEAPDHGLQVGSGQPLLRPDQAVGAEAVVRQHHRDPADADRGEVRHGFFGFAPVSGPHIEDVLAHRLVQHHGAGGRGDQRHTVLIQ